MLYTDKLVKNVHIMNNHPLLILISQIILIRPFLLIEHVRTISPPPQCNAAYRTSRCPLIFLYNTILANEKGHNFDIILELGTWGNEQNCLIVKLLKIKSRKGQVLANVKIQEG